MNANAIAFAGLPIDKFCASCADLIQWCADNKKTVNVVDGLCPSDRAQIAYVNAVVDIEAEAEALVDALTPGSEPIARRGARAVSAPSTGIVVVGNGGGGGSGPLSRLEQTERPPLWPAAIPAAAIVVAWIVGGIYSLYCWVGKVDSAILMARESGRAVERVETEQRHVDARVLRLEEELTDEIRRADAATDGAFMPSVNLIDDGSMDHVEFQVRNLELKLANLREAMRRYNQRRQP